METLDFVMAVHERFLLIPNPSLATVIFEEKKTIFSVIASKAQKPNQGLSRET